MRVRRPNVSILYRDASFEAGDGRTLFGRVVPYGQVAEVSDGTGVYQERFERGATARTIRERGHKIRLFTQHDRRRLPIGRAARLVEQDDGLHAEFEVARTRDGDDALELVRAGIVDSFSVGFTPVRERWDGEVLVRTEVALNEISLVDAPAYSGAVVAGIRSHAPLHYSAADVARRLRLLNL